MFCGKYGKQIKRRKIDMKQKKRKETYIKIFTVLAMLVFLFSWCSVVHAEDESVLLKDMHMEDSNECEIWEKELKDSYGNSYSGNIVNMEASRNSYAVYNLDGEYTHFSGKIVIAEDVYTDCVMDIAIYGDGRELYSKAGLTRQTEAQDFDLDVTGVGTLEIRSSGEDSISLAEAEFTQAEERTVPPTYASLGELTVIDSVDFEQKTCLQKDTFGDLHKGRQYFKNPMTSETESYALYNLDQKYLSFSGKLIIDEESTTNCNMNVQIYLDDQLVFEQNGIGRTTEPVEVNLDVTNVKVMKIRVVGKAGYLCVVDDVLKGSDDTQWETELEEEVPITVFFDEGTTQEQIDMIGEQIRQRPEVRDIVFTSSDDAWNEFIDQYFQGTNTAERDNNPLTNSANYTVYVNQTEELEELVDFIEGLDYVREVNEPD